jgi:cell shape-determining protein MreD
VKRAVALLALCALAPMVQGVVGRFVPLHWFPDLGLLLVVGLGLCWRSTAGGVVLSAALGSIADLLSGSLLGLHTLLRMCAFGAARGCSQQLNLRGARPLAIFVVGLTLASGVSSAVLTSFFMAGPGLESEMLRKLIPHALINGVFAPFGVSIVERISNWLGDADAGHQLLTIRPRSRLT